LRLSPQMPAPLTRHYFQRNKHILRSCEKI
jgi:hypothetical protein